MIRSLTITNNIGDSIELELTKPEKSGFIVKEITGLGPVKSTINITQVTTNDGGVFNSARLPYRNIVMNLRFMQTEKETIEDVRHKSYKYFPIKKQITILIKTDNRELQTRGYVESNEPNIFSENEESSISIICPDPYFYSTEINETTFSGIEPLFEFPFSNESLTEPLLELGSIQNMQEQVITYEGDADVGVIMTIHAIGSASNIVIYNTGTREQMGIDTTKLETITGSGIVDSDTIIINTKKNQKRITLLRNGVETNILNCLAKGSKWFTLTKGDNLFAYTAESGSSNLQFSIANEVVYSGI